MKGILKIILVSLNLIFLSRSLICSGETPLYQSLNGVESCVKECDSSLIEFTVDHACKDKSMCTLYISTDQKKCTTSCGTDVVALTYSRTFPYLVCKSQCLSYLYKYTENSITYCDDKCSGNHLSKYSNLSCLTNVNDCGEFVEYTKNRCKVECDIYQKEIPAVQNGINICQVCKGFIIPSTPTTKASCVETCPTGYIGQMNDRKCYELSTADSIGCTGMKISSDQKTCNSFCPFGDILSINGTCVPECTTLGCSNCPDGQVLDYQINGLECILSSNCSQKLSSDGKKCVSDCSNIGEQTQSNKCQKCAEGTVSYYTANGQFNCKPSGELASDEKDTSIQLTNLLKNSLNNYEDVKYFSSKVNEQLLRHYQELTSSSNIKTTFQTVEGYLKQFNSNIKYNNAHSDLIKFGSSSSIMSFYQLVASDTLVKTSLNMKSLLEGTLTDLTEQKNKLEYDTASSVTVQIIASNPACKISGCEKYPIIQAQTQEKGGSGRRILSSSPRTFTVEFTVTEASSKYICLNYNLDTSEVICPYSLPIVSNNGLTMTCQVNGATQLFLDSSDVFINSNYCSPPQASSSNGGNSGISTGGVIGIVIGALAGSILFSIGGFMLYKKFTKIKVMNYDAKQSQPVPNAEFITEPNTEP